MRLLSVLLLALPISLAARQAAACDGGVVAMIYQPAGAVFVAEVNGVPVGEALEPGQSFTGTRRLPPWLLPGTNEVAVFVETPSDEGAIEVFLNCPEVLASGPGKNANSFGVLRLDAAGRQAFDFEAPAGSTVDLPYSDAVHAGNAGLDDRVRAMQAAFRAGDVGAIVDEFATMRDVAAAMGQPIGRDQMQGMLSQVLPQADVSYLDAWSIREAMGGRLRVVTGPDRVTPPILMDGGRFRMKTARIWSHIDGDWRIVAQ